MCWESARYNCGPCPECGIPVYFEYAVSSSQTNIWTHVGYQTFCTLKMGDSLSSSFNTARLPRWLKKLHSEEMIESEKYVMVAL